MPRTADGSRQNSLDYLAALLRNQLQHGSGPEADLSSLDTSMVVMQILTAARESAQSHRTIDLKPLPK